MRRPLPIPFIAIVAVLATTGCSARHHTPAAQAPVAGTDTSVRPVGDAITIGVSPDRTLSASIPDVGQISGDAGAFTSVGSIEIRRQAATFGGATGLQSAGLGIDVIFHATGLRKPLTVAFQASGSTDADAVPVIAHEADDGSWNVVPATRDASGHFTISTTQFSINIPSWANPLNWWNSLTAKLASAVGGRTAPLNCAGAPSWFHLDAGHSDLVHVCAKTNHTGDGTEVAEVQIKSNRGVSVEVTVPGRPAYVWVEGIPWSVRKWEATQLGYDANQTVILPAGATMTVGYTRERTSAPFSFFVTGTTVKAAADTFIRDLVDLVGSTDVAFVAYTEVKCSTGFSAGPGGISIGVAALKDFLSCWTGALAGELRDLTKAQQVVSQLGAGDAATIVKTAKAAGALGWLVSLGPVYQLGFGNVIDKLHELLSDGQSAQVSYHMDPAPSSTGGGPNAGTQPGGGSTGGIQPGNGAPAAVALSQGSAAPQGYRYAVRLTGFPARTSVAVTCYDSTSPGGFYSFTMATDAAGNGFTQSQCYSADGPDHWVNAGGHESNHVTWGGGAAPPPPPPPPSTHAETVGGNTNTWTNYTNAGGNQGPTIPAYTTVQVSCRVTGFRVADGDTWWYRVASPGWDNTYYASADAFYNNGQTSGSLHGTPFVDEAVPVC